MKTQIKEKNPNIKPIFSRNLDIDKIAFLNWRMDGCEMRSMLNLAEGYLTSAISLTRLCLLDNNNKKADIIIFPILANANHGIELYLKGITFILDAILKNEIKIEGTHNLEKLYFTLKSRIKDVEGESKFIDFEVKFIGLTKYINELFEKLKPTPKNDKMDFPRYPFSKKNENHFYVDSFTNIEIDLENLIYRLEDIFTNFESLSDYFYYNKLQGEEF